MLDDILEFVLELVLEGAVELTASRKVPIPIRILLGVVLLVVFLGTFGLLLFIGIDSGSGLIIAIAILLFVSFLFLLFGKIRTYKK